MQTVTIKLDYDKSKKLSDIYQYSRVDHIDYREEGILMTLTSLPGNINHLRHNLEPETIQGWKFSDFNWQQLRTQIFGILQIGDWTSEGPFSIADFKKAQLEARKDNRHILVHSVDKFPRMTDYVTLSDVRIADANLVRLGAYLGSGTTIMHYGFVNFNAGSLGEAMIEGRISQGVVIGDKTDIGGGASTMGTLSGGNDVRISLGKNCDTRP